MIPEKELNFTTALTACSAADISRFENQDIGEYFEGGMDILQDPIVESIFVIGGAMGITGLPTIPLFFYKTIGDQVSSIGDTDVLVDKLCGMGVESLSYDRNSYGEHVSENFLGLQVRTTSLFVESSVLMWMGDREQCNSWTTGLMVYQLKLDVERLM